MKTLIIGGGVIGLSCAHFLQQQGREVLVLDQGDLESGCSYENAGMIVPSHFIPLAAPGMIAKGIRWMFDAQSPFYIQPRLDWDLCSWGWKFYRASRRSQAERAMPLLRDFNLLSKQLYQNWAQELDFSFAFTENGLLILCREEACWAEESHTATVAQRLGLEAQVLDRAQVLALEPNVSEAVIGGVYYPGDAYLSPGLLLEGLKKSLRQRGVTLQSHTSITDFEKTSKRITAVSGPQGRWEVDDVIIAGGSWSAAILRKLGISLPLQAGKGYSFMVENATPKVQHAAILAEAKVAVTPLGERVRFGGTMEIAGINNRINPKRVRGIAAAIPQYYRDFTVAPPNPSDTWSGLRPCSPDGLPYLGRVAPFSNLTLACGHAMMGLSLAPATGLLVAQLIAGKTLSLDLNLLNPLRYQ